MSRTPHLHGNGLLKSLPADLQGELAPLLLPVPVQLNLGEVLYESGAAQEYVYLPLDAIVSLLYVLESVQLAEIAIVGFKSMVGVSLLMGDGSTPSQAVVQSAGAALRLPASRLEPLIEKRGPLLHMLLRYTQALTTQIWMNLHLQTERSGLARIRLRTRWRPIDRPCGCNAAHSQRLP